MKKQYLLCTSIVLVTFATLQSMAQQPDLQAVADKALVAANSHRPEAFAPIAARNEAHSFQWVSETTTPKWSVALLQVPSQRPLIVFYAWHTCESDGDHVHSLFRSPTAGWKIGAEIPETQTGGYRVRDHDLNLKLQPAKGTVDISDKVLIETVAERPAPITLLRLASDYEITEATIGDAGDKLTYARAGGFIGFANPAKKNFTVSLKYHAKMAHGMSDYITTHDITLNSYWYPHIGRLPAKATTTVSAIPGWTPIAQGNLVKKETGADGVITVTYRNEVPCCYYTVDAGPYIINTRKFRDHTLAVYQLKENAKRLEGTFKALEQAFTFYEENFSKLPYETYTCVETLGPFPGALEGYSLSTYGGGALPFTVAHELAHSWWGGIVPCAYTASMWDESFASYSDDIQRSKRPGKGAERNLLYLRETNNSWKSFGSFSLKMAHDTSDGRQSSIGYDKGPIVLHVLEDELGWDGMKAAIQTMIADHIPGEAVEWDAFEAAVNKATKGNYSWFFHQWMDRVGLPSPGLSNVKKSIVDGTWVVEADIQQKQTPYRLKLPITLETKGAKVNATIHVEGNSTHIKLVTKDLPTRLVLDAEGTIPIRLPDDALIKDGVTDYEFK